jgi:DNA-binding SARP family transcriptional activator
MEFLLLGPVEVRGGQADGRVRATKPLTLLAALLLARGRVVSDSALSAVLWGEAPPSTSESQLQTYVSRLRRHLEPTVTIERVRPGYRLPVEPERLDVVRFERLVGRGRHELAAGRPAVASELLGEALRLWRGPALADVSEHLAETERPRLEEARLAALESRIDADLALGRHEALVVELTGLVAGFPLRERLIGQLMLALHRCGRQAGALTVYQEHRASLAAELGIDPGAELRAVHQAVLTDRLDPVLTPGTPAVDPAAAPAVDRAASRVVEPSVAIDARAATRVHPTRPRRSVKVNQLPAAPADFTGRTEELRAVTATLDGTAAFTAGCVVSGMPGVGKTALALRAAHLLADEFTDGLLHVDLHGSSRPLAPAQALRTLLSSLSALPPSVDADAAPPLPPVPTDGADDVDALARRYRDRLGDRRLLIALDDAADEHQVRPLLPGSRGPRVLITSRHRMEVLEGLSTVELGPLPTAESTELLTRLVGAERLGREPEALRQLLDCCGGLPLALRVVGSRLAGRPHLSLRGVAARAGDPLHRLDDLQLGDLSVPAAIRSQVTSLAPADRRALCLLALVQADRFTAWTAALALNIALVDAHDRLERLVAAHLLTPDTAPDGSLPGYRLHPLVRLAAQRQARAEESMESRRQALDRVGDAGREWLVREGRA